MREGYGKEDPWRKPCGGVGAWSWVIAPCLGLLLLCTLNAFGQSPSTEAALAGLVESTRALLHKQLEADESACKFGASLASFHTAMRDRGTPLSKALELLRQGSTVYPRWILWYEARTTKIYTNTLSKLTESALKSIEEIHCLEALIARNREPIAPPSTTQSATTSQNTPAQGPTWVLWAHDVGVAMPLGAWPRKEECEAQRAAIAQKSDGVSITCLPDTVNPQGQR